MTASQSQNSTPNQQPPRITADRIASWKVETRPKAAILTVSGEIDASNSKRLRDDAGRVIAEEVPLIVDLREVEFLGVAGVQALFAIHDGCRRQNLPWALVGGRVVRRLVRICDRADALPLADSIAEAFRRLDPQRSDRLRLVRSTGIADQ